MGSIKMPFACYGNYSRYYSYDSHSSLKFTYLASLKTVHKRCGIVDTRQSKSICILTQAEVVGCDATSHHTIQVLLGTRLPPDFRVTGGAMLAYADQELSGGYTLGQLQEEIVYLLRHVERVRMSTSSSSSSFSSFIWTSPTDTPPRRPPRVSWWGSGPQAAAVDHYLPTATFNGRRIARLELNGELGGFGSPWSPCIEWNIICNNTMHTWAFACAVETICPRARLFSSMKPRVLTLKRATSWCWKMVESCGGMW